ncbi:hypothetical protein RUND412_006164 [Rhizina undulata]
MKALEGWWKMLKEAYTKAKDLTSEGAKSDSNGKVWKEVNYKLCPYYHHIDAIISSDLSYNPPIAAKCGDGDPAYKVANNELDKSTDSDSEPEDSEHPPASGHKPPKKLDSAKKGGRSKSHKELATDGILKDIAADKLSYGKQILEYIMRWDSEDHEL